MSNPVGPEALEDAMWVMVKLGFYGCLAMGLFILAILMAEYALIRLTGGAVKDHLP